MPYRNYPRWPAQLVLALLLTLGIAILGAPTAPALGKAQPTTNTWPLFHFDPTRSGYSPNEHVVSTGTAPNFLPLWVYHTGGSILSSPAIVNNVVYVGSNDDNLYAINASTGALLKSYRTGGYILSSPAVANGVLYIGSDDGYLYAFNTTSGQIIWKDQIETHPIFGMASAPLVANGVVYATEYDEGLIFAVNASTGAKIWAIHVPGKMSRSSPALANGILYVGSADDLVYALDAQTGKTIWTFPTKGQVKSSPAVVNGIVYIGSLDGTLYALDATTGKQVWVYKTGGQVHSSPAVANGIVYFGSYDHNIYALDASTGSLIWSYKTGNIIDAASPAVANGVVYAASRDHNVYALNATTGQRLWSFTTGGYIDSSPAIANGLLAIGSADGGLYAFSTQCITVYPTSGPPGTQVTVAGSGFMPGESIAIYLGGGPGKGTQVASTTAGPSGTFRNVTFTVPSTTPYTPQPVVAVGLSSQITYTSVFNVDAELQVAPGAVPPTATVSIAGNDFAPNETVNCYLSNAGTPGQRVLVATATADASGSFSGVPFTVPPTPLGDYRVTAIGQQSGRVAFSPLIVFDAITIQPQQGPPGTMVTVNGAGFAANEPVQIYWNGVFNGQGVVGTYETTVDADGSGSFSGATFAVPANAAPGMYPVLAFGYVSFTAPTQPFTVTSDRFR
jgi:outer membrane protein assembly factor BamB